MRFMLSVLVGLLACFTLPAHAVLITASNDWSSCQLTDNISNAGDYYPTVIESTASILNCNQAYLAVTGLINSTTTWTVSVRLAAAPATNISLAIMRTGAGTGNTAPNGGDSYVFLSMAYQTFFSGQGNTTNIPLQFQLGNFDTADGNGVKNLQLEYQVTTTN